MQIPMLGFYQVPQGHTVIIERFGRFEKFLEPGLNFVNPLLYGHKTLSEWRGTASKCDYLMELTEQQLETNARRCQTKDNVSVEANAVIYFKISDPYKAIYNVDVLPQAIQDMCLNVLRSKIGSYGFDELFSKQAEISRTVTVELEEKVRSWGVDLKGVEIGKLDYDKEIYIALQKKRIAEAEKDAKITSVESEALTAIKKAETQLKQKEIETKIKLNDAQAEAETLEILAIAKAKAMEIEAQASSRANAIANQDKIKFLEELSTKIGRDGAVKLVSASKAVEGMEMLSKGQSKLVLMPNDFNGMIKLVNP